MDQLQYREHFEDIMQALDRGESSVVTGIGNVGARRFISQEVIELYSDNHSTAISKQYLFVPLFSDDLISLSKNAQEMTGWDWPIYELLISRMSDALRRAEVTEGIEGIYERLQRYYISMFSENILVVQAYKRHFESLLKTVFEEANLSLVFIFVEFESFLSKVRPEVFSALRRIRDTYRHNISFIVHTRANISRHLTSVEQYDRMLLESFLELLQSEVYITLLDASEARKLLNELSQRYGAESLSDSHKDMFLEIVGSHRGLLTIGYLPFIRSVPAHGLEIEKEKVKDVLLSNKNIQNECEAIYDALSVGERLALQTVIINTSDASEVVLEDLSKKQLLVKKSGKYHVSIPLFEEYLSRLNQSALHEQEELLELTGDEDHSLDTTDESGDFASGNYSTTKHATEKPRVFISYRRAPSALLAKLIEREMLSQKIDTFLDTSSIGGAQPFPIRLQKAIETCDVFICLLADATLSSSWVRREIEIASLNKKPMIPIFQESFDRNSISEPDVSISNLLQYDGLYVFDLKNIRIDETVEDLIRMVKQTVRP